MEKLSQRLQRLSSSATIMMNQKSKDLQAQGIDVINLSVGEPDFPTPDHIKNAAKKAIDDNITFYPPVAGYPELRKAIVRKLKTQNELEYDWQQIVVSTGAKHSIANVMLSLVDEGDEVVVLAPYWVTYVELVKAAGGKNVIINGHIENDFKVTPQQLEEAMTEKTRVVLLCTPSNPTGAVYSKNELEGLAKIIEKYPYATVIADEIYEHINFTGEHNSIAQFDQIKDQCVVVNGVSKGYAMTGWRIGYMAAPEYIAKAVIKLQGQMTSGCTTISQMAALEALTSDQSCTKEMNVAFERRRNLVLDKVKTFPGIKLNKPQGAFYIFPDVSSFFGKKVGEREINNSTDFCMYILDEANVATVPGEAFGEPACVRISYATSDEKLKIALNRIEQALEKIK